MVTTRGFKGRTRPDDTTRSRVPPGQYVTSDFPVLTAGPTQHTSLDDWTLSMQVAGRPLAEWSWQEFEELPQTETVTDIHCVTKWSKFDTRWRGATFHELLRAAGLAAAPTAFVIVHLDVGYSYNLPAADPTEGQAMAS